MAYVNSHMGIAKERIEMNSWELLGEDRPKGNFIEVILSTILLLVMAVIDEVWRWIYEIRSAG